MAGVVTAVLVAVTAGAGPVPAQASPEDERQDIERRLDDARGDLDQSDARFAVATEAYRRAATRLDAARTRLAAVRGQLAAARARDVAVAERLRAAHRAEHAAERAVAHADRRVRAQRHEIAAFANASYQRAGMAELAALVRSASPADLLGTAHIVTSVSESQRSALDRYAAALASAAAQEDVRVAAAREVAEQRAAAAANLARVRQLERRAEKAESSMRALLDRRARAREAASRARRDDQRRYEELLAERERIERLLREQAERERRRRDRGGGLVRPVDGPVTSSYGMRFHPILRIWKLHDGTDFGASCGTPIRAAASGEVISRYYSGGYGNRLLVAHGRMDGASVVTAYNHLSAFAVSPGEWVRQGEVIGYVGTTGYSTGCHLHFMVYRDGSTVDPMDYL